MTGALDGVKVIDFTQAYQGPWATQKLGDMGATVIKVEPPGGEWTRDLEAAGESLNGESPFFLVANRSKQSVVLDLKSDEGREIALELSREADVVVENFRPGVMKRLGLNYDEIVNMNPDIIYVSATGYGADGPYVERPGQDLLLQAISGVAASNGYKDDPPLPVPYPMIDAHSAMQIALKTMVALFHSERTGEGQLVEVNLLDSAVDTQAQGFTVELNLDMDFERSAEGIGQKYLGAPYGFYETADGYVAISMASLPTLAELFGIPELNQYDSQVAAYQNRDELKRLIEDHTKTRNTSDLINQLVEADVWTAPVNDFISAAEDPQVRNNDIIVEIDNPNGGTFQTAGIPGTMSKTPGEIQNRPPRAGEHTRDILSELGYGDNEISRLEESGAVELSGLQ